MYDKEWCEEYGVQKGGGNRATTMCPELCEHVDAKQKVVNTSFVHYTGSRHDAANGNTGTCV